MFCLLCSIAIAAPSISSTSGTLDFGETVVISGSDFGSKATAAPQLWDNFDASSIDTGKWVNAYSMTTTTNRQRHVDSTRSALGDMSDSWAAGSLEMNDESGMPGYGGKVYISIWFQCGDSWNWSDAVWSNGFKWMRIIDTDADDEFAWSHVSGSGYLTPNNGNAAYNMGPGWTPKDNMSINSWYHFEFIISTPSTNHSSTDATAKMYVNGDLKDGMDLAVGDALTWWGRDSADAIDHIRPYRFWHTNTGTPTENSNIYIDDAYIDNSWARVMVGNASTLATSTHREICQPTAWGASEITVTFNQGSFADEATAYLFVIDSDGTASSGYEIEIGASGASSDHAKLSGGISLSGGVTIS